MAPLPPLVIVLGFRVYSDNKSENVHVIFRN